MTQAKKEFEKERDELAWGSFPLAQPSDPKDLLLSMHCRGFKSGYTACLNSSIVRRMEEALKHVCVGAHADEGALVCTVLADLREIRGEE